METIPSEGHRFKTLLVFGKFLSLIGWIVVSIGRIMFLFGLSQLQPRNPFAGPMSPLGPMAALSSVLPAGPIALVDWIACGYIWQLVAGGQGISCFVSVENNTHAGVIAQWTIQTLMKGQPPALPTNAQAS